MRKNDSYGKAGIYLFNDGWEFAKCPLFTEIGEVQAHPEWFAPVGLPHDWLIGQGTALYEDGTGWYKKRFVYEGAADSLAFLRFEGVYMDSSVYLNGEKCMEWKYGYSTFEVPLAEYLRQGENEVMVRVDFQSPNSRWYSGAGIYRDVWLKLVRSSYLLADGIYTHVTKEDTGWKLEASVEGSFCEPCEVRFTLREQKPEEGLAAAGKAEKPKKLLPKENDTEAMRQSDNDTETVRQSENDTEAVRQSDNGTEAVRQSESDTEAVQQKENDTEAVHPQTIRKTWRLQNVREWDVETPNCYVLAAELWLHGENVQTEYVTIGFCTKAFDPDSGFWLNGRRVKLNGVCEHHDLGCLGSAYNHRAMERKLQQLKEMGVNALRLTHNMYAPDVMEMADSMGFLVVSEGFDMWERPKTTYDYGRFFPEWYKKDVASWIRRDRNHPSLLMWSIGNEIYDTHADERGQEVTRLLMEEVRLHDPQENGRVTIGSNYMPWENAQKCAELVKFAGYNYAEKYYNAHHAAHPDWIIYGSETSSTVQSRGVYHFPYSQSVLADVDEQCSCLGNATTSWGASSSEACVIAERDHDFSCGQFLWTGHDYIGEPTPYHTRNSYFGQVDTAGFPKDTFYIYQAEWTDYRKKPMVHVFPYWDFNEGQLIDVRVCSNAPMAELFVNGESQGIHRIDHAHGTEKELVGHWQVPFATGELTAKAYDENGREIASETRRSFGEAAAIRVQADRKLLRADGEDLAFLDITMEDCDGNPVENASNRVFVQVTGAGRLAGLDNGDSTDTEEYKAVTRRLFNGHLLAVVAANTEEGEIKITVSSKGMESACLTLETQKAQTARYGQGTCLAWTVPEEKARREAEIFRDDMPVRAIRLHASKGTVLTPDNPMTEIMAVVCPEDASDKEVVWSIVDDAGIPSPLAKLEANGTQAILTGEGDGRFRVRCMSKSGTGKIRVISELEMETSGFGAAFLDPYSFVAGGLYDYAKGDVTNGNDHGFCTDRDGETQVGFHNLAFGPIGSDEITLPVFTFEDREYMIWIYEGMPGEEGSSLIGEIHYKKPSVWNVYQPETCRLSKRLRGVTSICFVTEEKMHIQGFSFTVREKAWECLEAVKSNVIYGDSFRMEEDCVREIGNNVSLTYTEMDFGDKGTTAIEICGYTPMEKNTIQIRFHGEDGEEVTQLAEFRHCEEETTQTFALKRICGKQTVSFVFLPGSSFDFRSFRFIQM